MAISIVNQWPATAADQDCEIVTNPTAGRTLVAVIVSRVVDGSAPTLAIGDPSRNMWTLLADPVQFASSAHAGAQLQVEVWACPAVQYAGWPFELVYASAMQITASDVGSVCTNVVEVNGLLNQLAVDSVTVGTASATNTITLTAPAPTGGANVLQIAAAASDIAYGSYSTTGTGWTQLQNVVAANPSIGLHHAWREATTGGTVTFSLTAGFNQNWAGVLVALKTAGVVPAQPNPAWPATSLQIGLGYTLATPLSRVRWTDQTSRYLSVSSERGIQAELGTAQQGSTTLQIRNDDGAYSPRPSTASAVATAAGSTTTIKVADASATNITVADFFRLQSSTGTLKQLDVFQVTAKSSSAGTTTVTFKRADGTAGGALAATAAGDVYVGTPVDLYTPWRLVKVVAGTPYCVASGWLRDTSVTFADAHWSEVVADGADAVETLTAANPSILQGEIYRRPGLVGYWPLNDAAGSGYAANASGVSNAPLTETVSKYGAGQQTHADFGANTQNIVTIAAAPQFSYSIAGDPGTGWQQDGQTTAEINANKGYCLVGRDSFPPISGGVTICGALLMTADQTTTVGAGTTDPTIFILRNGDPGAGVSAGSIIKLSFGHVSGNGLITVWDKDTHASATTNGTGTVANESWQYWTLAFNRTSWAYYVNGFVWATGTCDLVDSFSQIEIGGEASQWYHGKAFPGTHAHIAIYNRMLTEMEIGEIGWSAINGREFAQASLPRNALDQRIARKLNTVGWPGTRIINTTSIGVASEGTPSGSIIDIATEVAGYHDGLFFSDAANQAQFRSRIYSYSQTVRATLGDGVGEIPFQPGVTYGKDPTYVYNDVEISNIIEATFNLTGGTSTLVAVDDTSAARYAPRTMQRTTRLASTSSAYHLAWWLLGRYAYPRTRIPSIVVSAKASNDTASSTGRWAFITGVEVGDIIVINQRPIGQPMISVRCQVLSVQVSYTYSTSSVTAQATLTVTQAAPQVAVLGAGTPLAGTVLGV